MTLLSVSLWQFNALVYQQSPYVICFFTFIYVVYICFDDYTRKPWCCPPTFSFSFTLLYLHHSKLDHLSQDIMLSQWGRNKVWLVDWLIKLLHRQKKHISINLFLYGCITFTSFVHFFIQLILCMDKWDWLNKTTLVHKGIFGKKKFCFCGWIIYLCKFYFVVYAFLFNRHCCC